MNPNNTQTAIYFVMVVIPFVLALILGVVGIAQFFKEKVGAGIALTLVAIILVIVSICVWLPLVALMVPTPNTF